jgi:tetratricopeptide (TPR) repeat protein
VVPRQLPASPAGFAGRSGKLAELDRAAAAPVVAIAGSGGVGKTWLALRWAHLNLSRFPDGQLYLNLRGFDPTAAPLTAETALRSMLEALGVPATALPEQPDAAAALLRSLTAGRRMLLLLDNARGSAHVEPLLPGSPTCTVLVTSRRTLTGLVTAHGAQPVALDVLDAAQSRDLLVAALGEQRVRSDPGAADGIIRRCAGLPLALRIVAARAAVNPDVPLAVLADELEGTESLDVLDGGELTVNVRAVLSSSLHALAPGGAEAFALLGLTPTPEVSAPVLASLVGQPVPRARALLQELLHFHMLHEFEPRRFRMHDLVRRYATELAQLTDDHRGAAGRLLDHYLHEAYRVNDLLSPGLRPLTLPPPAAGVAMENFGDQDAALAWYRREQQALVGAVEFAGRAGFDRHAWQLTCLLSLLFGRRGDWTAHLTTARVALDSAQRLGDPLALTNAHREVGVANINGRQFSEAAHHLGTALSLAMGIDAFSQAQVHRALGRLYAQQARWADALVHDRRALELYRVAGSDGGEARALNCIGWHLAHVGDNGEAAGYCRRALARYEQLGDPFGEALTLDSLAFALRQLGRHVEAVDCHRRSIELLLSFDRPLDRAKAWTQLAHTHEVAGDVPAAQTALREAVRIYTELGHPAADDLRTRLAGRTDQG